MSNYQTYATTATNNGENNQFASDINPNMTMINNFIQNLEGLNQANKTHMFNNNGNNLVYAMQSQNFNNTQQLQNQFNAQYGMSILQMNGNPMGVYVNPQQFINGEAYVNNFTQFIPVQNMPQGVIQLNVDDMNKNVQQRTINNRTRKRSYSEQNKQMDSGEMEYDHKNRPLIYNCKECPRKFSMNSRLNTHMRCHNGERPHVCLTCNFAFTQKSYLVRHAAVHKEERPYQCHTCKKTYKHYGSLANHRKTHKNGRKDMLIDNNGENHIEDCKLEANCTQEIYQNQEYIFAGQSKQEPQHNYMVTDLSTNVYQQPSDAEVSFIDQLNQFNQDAAFYNNTDQSDVPVSQMPSIQTSAFTS